MTILKTLTTKRKTRKKKLPSLVEFKGFRQISLENYQHHVRRMYDGPAGAVLALGSALSLHQPLVGRMLRSKKFDVGPFRSILDIGSGAGQILGHLLKEVCPATRLVACDLSYQMLRRARSRLKDDRPSYIAADLMQLPFRENSFECVTCGWVLEHLPDPSPGLCELNRVLKPGGSTLLLATEDTLSGAVVSRTWKCRTYNRRELREACDDAGLPWKEQLWFTRVHRFFKMGGILVEATKLPTKLDADDPARCLAPHGHVVVS